MMIAKTLGVLVILAAPAAAQGLPAGWKVRPDKGDAAAVNFAASGRGFHVTPGQAAVMYREADAVTGKFHTLATFIQNKAPTHPEAYGMFFGGKDLAGEGQSYVYLLVRGDGKFSVKKRTGAAATDLVPWTDAEAVHKADAAGKATNNLEIDGSGPSVRLLVNGKVVHTVEAADMKGIIGLRVNHGLDVQIDGFEVHRLQ